MFLCQWHVRTDKLARGAQSENCKFTTRLCRCSEPIIYTINDNNNNSPTTKGHRRIMMMMIGLVGAKNRFVTYLPSRDVQGRCACLSLSLCFSPSSARSTWHTHNCLSANVKLSGRPVGSPSRTLSLPQFSLLLLYISLGKSSACASREREPRACTYIYKYTRGAREYSNFARSHAGAVLFFFLSFGIHRLRDDDNDDRLLSVYGYSPSFSFFYSFFLFFSLSAEETNAARPANYRAGTFTFASYVLYV